MNTQYEKNLRNDHTLICISEICDRYRPLSMQIFKAESLGELFMFSACMKTLLDE